MLEAMPSVQGQDGRHHQNGPGHANCVRSRWLTSLKWNMASRNPDVSNWIGHAKCVRSRWPTSPKWTVASRGPDVSNSMLEAMPSVRGQDGRHHQSGLWLVETLIGHAKCVRSRWPTSLKWTKASRGPDVSNWTLEAMPSV
ncbi:hypothetical protein EMCRGX_G020753 [Ephydatia muelleri]